MPNRKQDGKLIETPQGLEEVLERIKETRVFGIDLEFIPERSYYPIICLVQINVAGRVYLVDPIRLPNLNSLWQLVADESIVKVLHAASQDLSIIYQRSGLFPRNIFDTQIAAGFLGLGYPAGYGKLLSSLFDLSLSKTESFTDWQARPLTPSQIDYAIDDALHLLPLYERLASDLEERERLSWVLEECKLYEENSYYVKETGREFLKVKGAQGLSRRKLAVLQALCLFREAEAKRIDKPPKFVLNDNILLELAKKPPTKLEDIQRIRGVRDGQVSGYGKTILKAVSEALSLSEADCPQWPSGKAPSKADVLIADVLFTVLKVRAQEIEIAPELIATRDDLQKFVRFGKSRDPHRVVPEDEAASSLECGWRYNMAGDELLRILEGAPLTVTIANASSTPISIKLAD